MIAICMSGITLPLTDRLGKQAQYNPADFQMYKIGRVRDQDIRGRKIAVRELYRWAPAESWPTRIGNQKRLGPAHRDPGQSRDQEAWTKCLQDGCVFRNSLNVISCREWFAQGIHYAAKLKL